jgi:hypothetical protein
MGGFTTELHKLRQGVSHRIQNSAIKEAEMISCGDIS